MRRPERRLGRQPVCASQCLLLDTAINGHLGASINEHILPVVMRMDLVRASQSTK